MACGRRRPEARYRHVIIWCPGVTERRFRAAIRLCAGRWGFGRQIDVQPLSGEDARTQARKAGYCAVYVTKGGETRDNLGDPDR